LKQNKKIIFKISIGYYRLGVESNNPYIALSNYFSSVSTIVRDLTGYEEVRQGNLKDHMRAIVGNDLDFDLKFKDYYNSGRSASTHGHIDAMNKNVLGTVRKSSFGMKHWTRRILVDYLNQNQD